MDDQVQPMAEKVNLGRYQFAAEAIDEEGRTGRWVFHRPTLGEVPRIAAKAEMLKAARTTEGTTKVMELPDVYEQVAYMLATLDAICDLRPSWFPKSFEECYDLELVADLFNQYEVWMSSFRPRVREDSE